jgi:hypothetical protein
LAESSSARVITLSLIYLLVALALLPVFRYEINPDGISYISIARRYLAGDLHGAINGYWGPLFSWALVPFLALRIDPLLAGKLLSILIGLLTIPGLDALASRFALPGSLRMVVLAALLPALWAFSFQNLSPDSLVVCLLVWYFSVIFDPRYRDLSRSAALCGVLGALTYFAKAYGFYFFLAHFTLMTILLCIGGERVAERRAALRNYAVGLAVFVALAGGWIVALSDKYGGATVAATGSYNHALTAPGSGGHPMHTRGFMAPRDGVAISVWEDPSFIPLQDWSATASAVMMEHQVRLFAGNLRAIALWFLYYSRLAAVFVVAYILFCVQPLRRSLRPGGEAYPLLTLLLYPAGYALFLVEGRYLFVGVILLALMGAHVSWRLAEGGFLTGRRQAVAWVILALSIAAQPVIEIAIQHRDAKGRAVQALCAQLARQTTLRGNIASNDRWAMTLYIAYHLGLRYFGTPGDTPAAAVVPDLARLGVRYYFVWDGSAEEQERFQGYPEVTGGAIARLRVYQLADP